MERKDKEDNTTQRKLIHCDVWPSHRFIDVEKCIVLKDTFDT